MPVHPDIEPRRVRYLDEHDVLILKQHAVNIWSGNLGIVGSRIRIASPRRPRILSRLTVHRHDTRKRKDNQPEARHPKSHV